VKVLDCFAGIGGFTLGLERAGFETVAFCEIEPYCQRVLAKHWPEVPIYDDIRRVTTDRLIRDGIIDMPGHLKKLTPDQVIQAAKIYEAGFSYAETAEFFGVTRQAMWEVLKARGVQSRPQLRFGKDNHFYRGGPSADDQVHRIVEKAIARGKLQPQPCEVCGANGVMADGRNEVQAHHDDYNKPLDVRWLCQEHHHEWHKTNRPVRRRGGTEPAGIDVITGGFP
jgi:hypothetical protein